MEKLILELELGQNISLRIGHADIPTWGARSPRQQLYYLASELSAIHFVPEIRSFGAKGQCLKFVFIIRSQLSMPA